MHPNAALIERFYLALRRRDASAMASCYHPEVHFSDEAFDLHGDDAGLMWHMLCSRGRDMQVEYGQIVADDSTGSAHWEARYTFSSTGRKVHNIIDASFGFRDGLIVRHLDRFSFWRWSRQALGMPGLLLGWSGFLRRKVRATAAASLLAYGRKSPSTLSPAQP